MATLMELVHELKTLNARRKSGEKLSAADELRRTELKDYVRTALGKSPGEDSGGSAPARPAPSAPPAVAMPAPTAMPPPVVLPPPGMMPAPSLAPVKPVPLPVSTPAPRAPPTTIPPSPMMPPPTPMPIRASRAELEEAEEAADRAVKALKRRTEDVAEAKAELQEMQEMGGYTPREATFADEGYFSAYGDEGYAVVSDAPANLAPIDSREAEVHRAVTTKPVVPRGLVFLDDFAALYSRGILSADDELAVDKADPSLLIPGKRKVTVHLLNGEKRQGAIREMRRGDLGFKLEPVGSGSPETMSISQVKAVFIHQQPNATAPSAQGRLLTVTFRDSRSVQGNSDDYAPGVPVFTLVPPAGRGQFERIIVNGAAVTGVQ